jgi:hypothetical protein
VSWVQVRRDNHLLDCEIYSDACADPEWMPSLMLLVSHPGRQGRRVRSSGVSHG